MTTLDKLYNGLIESIQEENDMIRVYIISHSRTKELIGFCLVEIKESPFNTWMTPSITYFFILEKFRQRGYGIVLFDFISSLYKYKSLYIWTTQIKKVNFYKKFGFFVCSIIPMENEEKSLHIGHSDISQDIILLKKNYTANNLSHFHKFTKSSAV